MSEQASSSDHISSTIGGSAHGQIATGKDIHQTQVLGAGAENLLAPEERVKLAQLFEELRAQVRTHAEPGVQQRAVERVDELQDALTAEDPDLTTVQLVKRWFGRHVPKVAGGLSSLLLHPLVGRLVEAGGDALARELGLIAETDA